MKSVKKFVMVIGFIVLIVGIIIASLFDTGLVMNNAFFYYYIAAVLATTFIFSKNEIVKYVGYGLAAVNGGIGLSIITSAGFYDMGAMIEGIGLLTMLLSSFLYIFEIFLGLLGFIKTDKVNSEKKYSFVEILEKYKQLQKDGIVTEEEYEELKNKTLNNTEKKVDSFDDLKKWKKLLDQEVITEEEFSEVKASYFKK